MNPRCLPGKRCQINSNQFTAMKRHEIEIREGDSGNYV